jgi:hypothetical protein
MTTAETLQFVKTVLSTYVFWTVTPCRLVDLSDEPLLKVMFYQTAQCQIPDNSAFIITD